jgi:cyclophilin family peptidyl-prolyl cis-trans isomerase/HEAT repeat protein
MSLSFRAMRTLAPLLLLLGIACTTAPKLPQAETGPSGPHGLTIEEEARVLALEDRREYDAELVKTWAGHANALHRSRIAMALGRIAPHTFLDANRNGERDAGEGQAGVEELIALSHDPDRNVREAAVFALGEAGDEEAVNSLFTATVDSDGGVSSEAIEALSKLGEKKLLTGDGFKRYKWLTDKSWPEGPRARAIRYLFRFEAPEASQIAMESLGDTAPAIRQEAAYALSRKAHAPARAQLELLLTDPNTLTRAHAATALGRIGDPASVAVLVRALGDDHPWVRTNAAVAISRIGDKDMKVFREEDLPRIFATTDDADPGVRAAAIDVLGLYAKTNSSARARLRKKHTNGTSWERELATGALARISPTFVTREDLSPWEILRIVEAKPGNETIRSRYVNHESALVRAAVVASPPDNWADREAAAIRSWLSDPDVVVRASAIEKYALVTTEPGDVWLTTLEELEKKERGTDSNDARISAIHAIAQWERPQRAAFLRGLLADADPVVRRVAADLIVEKLGAKRPQYTPLPVSRTQSEYEEIVRWSRQPHTATIHMPRGRIELALLTQEAPVTTWNFAQLATKKFFDNSSFMRVVPNFVIQGGDPRNDMSGGPGYAIRDEINLQKYTRGAVGMALSGPDTGGSQFFVTHSPQPHLDGGYTIFARVYEGMSGVVDQTERGDRVDTITIDERPPVSSEKISSIAPVSLPLVVGPLTEERILQVLPSYATIRDAYAPDSSVLEMMKSYLRPRDRIEVYMGTWCDDSGREVPKLLRITRDLKTQFDVEIPTTYIAIDRSKREPARLLKGKAVAKVATFIVYRGAKELGRIEERPQGLFEDDLLTILARRES